MRLLNALGVLLWFCLVNASIGDLLPEFQTCIDDCLLYMRCPAPPTVFDELLHRIQKRFVYEDFTQNKLWFFAKPFWSCASDCDYKCQQLITKQRKLQSLPVVQFHGKWPFNRVLGIQEFFSVVFSYGNFHVNYINLFKLLKQYNKNKKAEGSYDIMSKQYIILIVVSLVGWIFSMAFHFRDNAITETLDYYGAFGIILTNFGCITTRYFLLFKKPRVLLAFQATLVLVFVVHCIKLKLEWNYSYNILINLVFGISAMALWILHALQVRKVYLSNYLVYNNSLQLLPFETKILNKLNHLSISRPKLIPTLPIFFNLWLLAGMTFELADFAPVYGLIDAHCIWHLFTIFPTIFWYDWNVWDVEFLKVVDANKAS